MKASDIEIILNNLAPQNLAYDGEELGFVVGDKNKEVNILGVTERPTSGVLSEAIDKKADMLIIHEPLYQAKKTSIVPIEKLFFRPNLIRESLVKKGDFCIFRYHSQWDDASKGNNETLAKKLNIKITKKLPYGRLGTIDETSLKNLTQDVKKLLNCPNVLVVGDLDKPIKTVAVVAGTGNSLVDVMEFAKQNGADVLISGDIQDSRARYAQELDLAIIDAGDYYTEVLGTKNLVKVLEKELPNLKILHLDPGPPWQVI